MRVALVHVPARGGRVERAFAHAEGGEALGYVLENRLLGAALWSALGDSANVTVRSPARVTGVAAVTALGATRVSVAGRPVPLMTLALIAAPAGKGEARRQGEVPGDAARDAWRWRGQAEVHARNDAGHPAREPATG